MGFFSSRYDGLVNGVNTTADSLHTILATTVGTTNSEETSPGLIGGVRDIILTTVDAILSRDKGLLNPSEGYNKWPWEKNSIWNPFRHLRKAAAGITSIVATTASRAIGVISSDIGGPTGRTIAGITQSALSLPIGDFTEDITY